MQVNRDRNFLDSLAEFLIELDRMEESEQEDTQQSNNEYLSEREELNDDDEFEEETERPRRGREAALAAYGRAVRTQAYADLQRRKVRRGTRNERVVRWIGQRGLEPGAAARVGRNQRLSRALGPLLNPVKGYIDGIATRYREYRRVRQSEAQWYSEGVISRQEIGFLETDMLLLSILRFSKQLLRLPAIRRDLDDPFWVALQPIHEQYKNQVVADEVTDFSPVQIACMVEIAHPLTQSFFACGDFNQRITSWGTRKASELRWADQRISLEKVTIGYRQSKQLNELARAIVKLGKEGKHDVVLPEDADREGVAAVLLEGAPNIESVCSWLAKRVVEIERFVGQLPSIAVLVPEEEQVGPLAESLGQALYEQNVNVVACRDGQVIGRENDIRVFDAQHIKGLEFEAAFFVDVDCLATLYPDLFDKFLYVGVTRAAMYLGITCGGKLPSRMESLRKLFAPDWKDVQVGL